jgi:hypothetical protein
LDPDGNGMSLTGSLSTMPLTDLLQWLAAAGKTGTLQVERNRAAKWISFERGRVVGCSSDDPPHRLGQYLLSRDKITEDQLRESLALQARTSQHLGRVLVEMGVITKEDLAGHLVAKAEETIYSVFDWDDGVFRFEEEVDHRGDTFPLELRVDDILLRGLKRFDEMKRIRQVFHDPGIVLRYTDVPPGAEIFSNKMARTMYAAIDGDRSIAEILLQLHGSEYIVYKFLFELHRNGYVEMAGIKRPAGEPVPALAAAGAPVAAAALPAGVASPAAARPGPAHADAAALRPGHDAPIEDVLARVRDLMTGGEHEEALDALAELYRQHPADDALRRLTAEAEATFVDRAYRHVVPPDKVPVLKRSVDSLTSESLSPQEFFLLSRIDGSWDVKSIIQVAPLREVDALRTLKRMREIGMIELRDPPD